MSWKIRDWPIAAFVACVVLLGLIVAHEMTYDLAPLLPDGEAAVQAELQAHVVGEAHGAAQTHGAPAAHVSLEDRARHDETATPLVAHDGMHAWLEPAGRFGLGGLLVSSLALIVLAARRSASLSTWARAPAPRVARARRAVPLVFAPVAFLLVELVERIPSGAGLPPLQVAVVGVLVQVVIAFVALIVLTRAARFVADVLARLRALPDLAMPEAIAAAWNRIEPRRRTGRAAGIEPSRGPPSLVH